MFFILFSVKVCVFSSVQFSHSVVSDSLWPHGLQHARPPCPSSTPRVYPNSYPSSWWCHPTISSSVVPFFSCPQSLPASESFPMSQLFAWGGQSTGVSALASFLPKKSQGWSPSEWTGWISLQSKGLSRVFSNTTVRKHQFFGAQLSSQSNSHPYMTTVCVLKSESEVTQLCLTLCDPMDCSLSGSSVHGNSPGKNTGVGCHALLQGIFPTQGLNLGLLHYRQILYHLITEVLWYSRN